MDVWRWWPYAADFGSTTRSMASVASPGGGPTPPPPAVVPDPPTPPNVGRDEDVCKRKKTPPTNNKPDDTKPATLACSFSKLDSLECATLGSGGSSAMGRRVRFQSSSSHSSSRNADRANFNGSTAWSGSVWDGAGGQHKG